MKITIPPKKRWFINNLSIGIKCSSKLETRPPKKHNYAWTRQPACKSWPNRDLHHSPVLASHIAADPSAHAVTTHSRAETTSAGTAGSPKPVGPPSVSRYGFHSLVVHWWCWFGIGPGISVALRVGVKSCPKRTCPSQHVFFRWI